MLDRHSGGISWMRGPVARSGRVSLPDSSPLGSTARVADHLRLAANVIVHHANGAALVSAEPWAFLTPRYTCL